MLGEFAASVVFVGHPRTASVAIEFALYVYKAPVVVKQQAVAFVAIFFNGGFPGGIAALAVIHSVVGITVVHAFLPPAECKHGVAAYRFAGCRDAPRKVIEMAQVFAVLVLENDALPARHVLHPLGHGGVMPPAVGPAAVDTAGRCPVALVRHYDAGVVAPGVAAHGVRVAVEASLEPREVGSLKADGSFVRIHPQAVPCLLEGGVVRAEV